LSAVTKVFIVFHVVLSLVLAAGLIVFVNRTEDFKTTIANLQTSHTADLAKVQTATAEIARQAADAASARTERDAAIAAGQSKLETANSEIARLNGELASAAGDKKVTENALVSAQNALNASLAANTALTGNLDTARATGDKLGAENSRLNLAVADLTNRLEVAVRQVTNLNEAVAQYKELSENQAKKLADAGIRNITPENSGLANGAPPINGIIRSTTLTGGIRYATISVGSQDQVKPGMKFSVIDRAKSKFLGELTVEKVDEHAATGRLEGPAISEVHDDYPDQTPDEVKTQL